MTYLQTNIYENKETTDFVRLWRLGRYVETKEISKRPDLLAFSRKDTTNYELDKYGWRGDAFHFVVHRETGWMIAMIRHAEYPGWQQLLKEFKPSDWTEQDGVFTIHNYAFSYTINCRVRFGITDTMEPIETV